MKIRVSLPYNLVGIVTICLFTACAMQKESVTTAGSTRKPTKQQREKLERVIVTGSTLPTDSKEVSAPDLPRSDAMQPDYARPEITPSHRSYGDAIDLKKLQRLSYVKLFYATDRTWTGSKSQPKWFGSQWNEREQGHLTYGTCDVSIPVRVHKTGEIEKPSILRLELSEDPEKHVIVYTPQRLARAAFFTALENDVRAKHQREIMVFIHGFNNTFDDAASRLGVLDYDLQFGGTPVLYSWTSVGGGLKGVWSYTKDGESVRKTYRPLADFLFEVAQSGWLAGAKRVNIIAHSMGNRALVEALKDLAVRKQGKLLFDEVVMAAPDVGMEGFATDEWPKMQHSAGGPAKRVTLYASSDDRALQASETFHHYRRIGEAGNGLLVLPGLDTVDASGADFTLFGLNHAYFGGPRVLRDLGALLQKGLTPAARKLQEMKRAPLSYWLLPRLANH
jgi:esterase/lipase superfamily enzyme